MVKIYKMTYAEFKRQVTKAGLTIREFSHLLKLHPSTISNYAKDGKIPTHYAVIATLMGEMKEYQIDFKYLIKDIDIKPNKPRGWAAKGTFGGSRQNNLL